MFRHQICIFKRAVQPISLFTAKTFATKNKQLLEKLSTEFGNTALIESALKNEELNYVHIDEWRNRIDVLKKYHLKDSHCLGMIVQCPSLLKIPLEDFEETLQQWFLADLGLSNFHHILLKQPELLEVDVERIRKRLPHLRVLFRTATGFAETLAKSPNLMFDDWNSILDKINYLINERRFKIGEIMQSSALSDSKYFIKFRLDLLEKCGVYKQDYTPVHKKNEYDKSKHKNPPLKSILVKNPKIFVNIAKISLEEYLVYSNLYTEEEDEFYETEDLKKSYQKK